MWRPWEREQPYPQHADNEEGSHRHSDSEEIVVDVVSNSDSGDVSDNNGEFSNDGEISATPGTSRLIKNSIRTISKQSQTIVCNVHEYVVNNKVGKGSITETAKIVKLSRPTVRKIVSRGPVTPKKPGNKRARFNKIDNFVCDIIRQEIYKFYKKGQPPTISELLQHLQNISSFPYKETMLRSLVKKLGFRFRTLNKRRVIMESSRIVSWRYKYLHRLHQLRSQGYDVVYLDETWFDTHDTVKKGWDDGTCGCAINVPVSRGKRIMVLHAGGAEGWAPNCLYLSAKNISDAKADSHDEMNATVFENWFKNLLLQNLSKDRKYVIVLDNASYHSRQLIKIPTKSSNKSEIIEFMKKFDLPVPDPVPIKLILLERIKAANINKMYAVDEMARKAGHEVLRLPPYYCILNPIELVWARLKSNVRKSNITPQLSASVCEALRNCTENIDAEYWRKCVEKTMKVERGYYADLWEEEDRLIIHVADDSDDDSDRDSN